MWVLKLDVVTKQILCQVEPSILEFNSIGDKKHFELTIRSSSALGVMVAYARLIWTEQSQEPHTVSSPIVIMHQRMRLVGSTT